MNKNLWKWIDPSTGLRCIIIKQPLGFLCGYVRIPRGALYRRLTRYRRIPKPAYPFPNHAEYECSDMYNHHQISGIEVHGGVTFLGKRHNIRGLWIGFDCAHSGDLIPGMRDLLEEIKSPALCVPGIQGIYRDHDYVRAEVGKLAKQIAEII